MRKEIHFLIFIITLELSKGSKKGFIYSPKQRVIDEQELYYAWRPDDQKKFTSSASRSFDKNKLSKQNRMCRVLYNKLLKPPLTKWDSPDKKRLKRIFGIKNKPTTVVAAVPGILRLKYNPPGSLASDAGTIPIPVESKAKTWFLGKPKQKNSSGLIASLPPVTVHAFACNLVKTPDVFWYVTSIKPSRLCTLNLAPPSSEKNSLCMRREFNKRAQNDNQPCDGEIISIQACVSVGLLMIWQMIKDGLFSIRELIKVALVGGKINSPYEIYT